MADAETRKAQTTGSLRWLIDSYMASAQWKAELSAATRTQRAGILTETKRAAGHEAADGINTPPIQKGMDKRAAQPHAANNWLKAMRGLFGWAVALNIVPADPARSVKLLAGANDRNGFHTWTEEEVARFERGTRSAHANGWRATSCSTPACDAAMLPDSDGRMSTMASSASCPRQLSGRSRSGSYRRWLHPSQPRQPVN